MVMNPAGLVAGKSVIVTGGGSGIGRATVLLLVNEGAKVVLGDIDVAGGEETARLAAEAGGEAGFVRTDVAKTADVDALVNRAVALFGRLDGAVNNAGIDMEADPAMQWEESTYDRMAEVNGKSIFTCLKREIAQMVPQAGGSIVNIGSIVSFAGAPGRPAYVACKHAAIGLTRTAALEFAKNNIRVNAVCPGGILTPLMEKDQALKAAVAAANPMGRLGDANEVAEAVVWLLSDRSSYVNGHSIVIDGGFTA
ncbi:glucose 1-dehydrogenase [Sphingosinicella soli]|uniref:NAD(P)-dependent dehydrogenase (Short-subunit alcohol dehydrogenase family) n=1 Tax=Sphingosinicella soli TaxID=333708 RepID=A0A7W7B4F8_9SPHN|nr:glucose 1-dehydrogenase [Sphingosinicella soli]MBB4633836.1 NAD(P)-dependent dehydrogenase (short-subunit alcohol dehydrogenase family) [Sphingosinicella soli]